MNPNPSPRPRLKLRAELRVLVCVDLQYLDRVTHLLCDLPWACKTLISVMFHAGPPKTPAPQTMRCAARQMAQLTDGATQAGGAVQHQKAVVQLTLLPASMQKHCYEYFLRIILICVDF